MSEIKFYLVRGTALFGESHYPERRKFVKIVRALNEKQAMEYIYSFFGSKNKIKRHNIKIEEIREINEEEIADRRIKELAKLEKIIV
ncbi:MAG: 50S ribosomal protein L18Ae [Saccharolobus sp.]|jgi:large subunit ribosomal protein LX|uniref:50S ribosomal protein L18Ae n=1 Tax=Saccharolobus sp. TaxID=2100761 RepID=UPI0028CF07B6|nr:50S ribosomal protein L18Ae [Saccharolobus sp.]MDT7861402.1 50S ribosomal protein L18Ae [Saccharolobus sp.]